MRQVELLTTGRVRDRGARKRRPKAARGMLEQNQRSSPVRVSCPAFARSKGTGSEHQAAQEPNSFPSDTQQLYSFSQLANLHEH